MTFTNLQRRIVYGDLDLTSYPFMVLFDGEEWTSGDLVTTILSSFLQDGELELSDSRGNMSLTIPIGIEGADLANVATAQALLAMEAAKPTNTLLVDPGDDVGAATVFETFRGTPDFNFAAAGEQNGLRRFALRLTALPHGRSVDEVVSPATTSAVTTVIDSGSSATPWTALFYPSFGAVPANLTVTQTTGPPSTVSATSSSTTGTAVMQMIRFGAIDTSSKNYVVIDWKAEASPESVGALTLADTNFSPSGNLSMVSEVASPTSGYTRTTFFAPSTGLAGLRIGLQTGGGPRARSLFIDNVSTTNVGPPGLTSRTQVRAVTVAGSARTQGALTISSATTGLGDTFVYTYPGDSLFVPMLRPFYTTGAALTTETTNRSGKRNNLSTPLTFSIPGQLVTSGLYGLIARLRVASGTYSGSVKWTAQTYVLGQAVGRQLTGTTAVSLTTNYAMFPLGTTNLPPTALAANTGGVVRVTIEDAATGTATILCDDVYMPNLTIGRYSLVRCGSGTPNYGILNRLWLKAATLVGRTPTVLIGLTASGEDAYYAGDAIQAEGLHEFVPPTMKVFVSADPTDLQVDLAHFPRWLGHAAS